MASYIDPPSDECKGFFNFLDMIYKVRVGQMYRHVLCRWIDIEPRLRLRRGVFEMSDGDTIMVMNIVVWRTEGRSARMFSMRFSVSISLRLLDACCLIVGE
jgi:hypothetical protein